MLMNARFVCKGVATDDRFIRLHCATNDRRKQLTGGIELLGLYSRIKRQVIGSDLHRHHDFFERCIAGAFANAIDRTFNLARACFNGGQAIGDGQAKVVMAMHANRDVAAIPNNLLAHSAHQPRELCRHRVTNRIWRFDDRGAGVYCSKHLA